MLRARDTLHYVLRKKCVDDPGTTFRYSTGAFQLLAGVLWVATGQLPQEFARRRLFGPLDIDEPVWVQTRDGVNCGGTHLQLQPRDMVKLGMLCLSRGMWHGQAILPADWVDQSTRVHAGKDWWEGPYGYGWWIRPDGYCAYGFGGQFIYVVPSQQLVVVMTARVRPRRHILVQDLEKHVVGPLIA
jgi:CubicO group peptidase (beta-lactamase class C family)